MNELWIAVGGLIVGSGATIGILHWHAKQMRRVVSDERQQSAQRINNLSYELTISRNKGADLLARQTTQEAYESGFADGMRFGAELTDVERMAYNLEQKQPGRIMRMARYRRNTNAQAVPRF